MVAGGERRERKVLSMIFRLLIYPNAADAHFVGATHLSAVPNVLFQDRG